MRGLLATFRRELRAYLFSPMAYAVLAVLLAFNGIVFAFIASYLADPRVGGGRPLDAFFNLSWLVLWLSTPLLTMRLLAEERRSGSIEVLMTAPVSETQVVLGKYLAALAFFVVLWLPTLAYAGILEVYSDIDWGTVAAGYLGLFGLGAMLLAVGLFASSLTRSQIVAGLVGMTAIFVLFIVFGWMEGLATGEAGREVFAYLDALAPLRDYARGIVDTRSLVYYLSSTVFFLFLATRALAANKWR